MAHTTGVFALATLLALGGCAGAPGGDAAPDGASDIAVTPDASDQTAAPDATVADLDVAPDAPDAVSVDVPTDAAFRPAPHGPGRVLPDQGGPRLVHPALVTVTFPGDARRAELEGYAAWIVGSSWLASVGAEYGIGAGTVGGTAQRPAAAPPATTSAEIEAMLAGGILDGSIPRPADALYLVYYPAATAITATFVNRCGTLTIQSCTDWGAYHTDAHVMGLDIPYAVMADCGATAALTALEHVERNASHEIVEAATDPFESTRPAYQLRFDPADPWSALLGCGVENADLCELPALSVREGGHVAQRSWSNAAAAAGGDPCVPSDPAVPYFNTEAAPDAVLHVAPGATVAYTLRGWSTAPGPDWRLSTAVQGSFSAPASLAVTLALSATTLNNGGTATLRITAPASATPGSSASILLWSTRSSTDRHATVLGVTTP